MKLQLDNIPNLYFYLQTVSFTPFVWIAYCCSVAVIFIIIKLFNYRLHLMFDSKDTKTIILTEAVSSNQPSGEVEKNGKTATEEASQNMMSVSDLFFLCNYYL